MNLEFTNSDAEIFLPREIVIQIVFYCGGTALDFNLLRVSKNAALLLNDEKFWQQVVTSWMSNVKKPDEVTWKKFFTSGYPIQFIYRDEKLDKNGVFYWLGSHDEYGRKIPYENPQISGAIRPAVNRGWYTITNRTTDSRNVLSDIWRNTQDENEIRDLMLVAGNNWGIGVDFGEGRSFLPTHYTIYQSYDPDVYQLSWHLEGYDEVNSAWVPLDIRKDCKDGWYQDTFKGEQHTYQFYTWECNQKFSRGYRWIRFVSLHSSYTLFSAWEFYGTLFRSFPPKVKYSRLENPGSAFIHWPDRSTAAPPVPISPSDIQTAQAQQPKKKSLISRFGNLFKKDKHTAVLVSFKC